MKRIEILFIIILFLLFAICNNIYTSRLENEVSDYLTKEYNLSKNKMKIKSVYSFLEYKFMCFETFSPEKAIVYYDELIISVSKYENNKWSDDYLIVKELYDRRIKFENLISSYSKECYVIPQSSHDSYIIYVNCKTDNQIDELINSIDDYVIDEEAFVGYSLYIFNNDNLINDLKKKAKGSLDGLVDRYKELEFDDFSNLNNENIIYRIKMNHINQKQFEKFEIIKKR